MNYRSFLHTSIYLVLILVKFTFSEFHVYSFNNYWNQILSNVSTESVSITIEPKGSYLDVIESAVIHPMMASVEDIAKYWIEGSIALPEKSTLVQILYEDSANVFSSKIIPLYPKEHFPTDTIIKNPIMEVSYETNRDGRDLYTVKLHKVTMGQNYKISMRYHVPNLGSAVPSYYLNVLCNSTYSNPGFLEFSYRSKKNGRPYYLDLGNSLFKISDGQSLQIPYQQNYIIRANDSMSTTMHITNFSDSLFGGKYLLLNTSIPDSVIIQLSKPIELLFLWRWNKPSCFVQKNSDIGTSWLTSYGQIAIEQAAAIKNMITEVAVTGNKAGMVHSIQYRKPEVFPLCKINSAAYTVIDSYLSQMDEAYFLNSGYYEEIIAPANPSDTLYDSSRTEFLNSLKIVNGLYSNGQGVIKHLVIVTCGPIRNSTDIISIEELEPLMNEISVSCDGAFWKDVSFANIKGSSLSRNLIDMFGFQVPQFKPSSLILQVSNSSKTHSFPLSTNQESFSIIAKSEGDWDSTLTWYGFDYDGLPFDTAKSTITPYTAVKDTGLVKLWAANKNRLIEKLEIDISSRYGVISENYNLRICSTFISEDTSIGYAQVYNVKENTSNKGSMIKRALSFICQIRSGNLFIATPENQMIKRIRIFSLNGTLIAEVNVEQYNYGEYYSIPLNSLVKNRISCMVILRIEGDKNSWTKKIWLKR